MAQHQSNGQTGKTTSGNCSPNHKLYILLLLAAIGLTVVSLLFQNNHVVFSIWTSITCGGIASIVVAWLIDITNCRTTYKRLLENRKTLLQNLYNTFDTSLQLIIYETSYNIQCIDSKKWHEWIESTNELAADNHDLIENYNRSFIVFFDDIAEQIFAIKSQEAILLDAGIIQSEDVQALSTILSICDATKVLYQSTHDETVRFSQFVTICSLLYRMISFAPSLRPINDLKIEPRLYIISLKDEIEEEK